MNKPLLLWLAGLSVLSAAFAAESTAPMAAAMPQIGDCTYLSWREGPPYMGTASKGDAAKAAYASERRFLRVQTGHFALEVDTEQIGAMGFERVAAPLSESAAEARILAGQPLAPATLRLVIHHGGKDYVCTGRAPTPLTKQGQPVDALRFPVRVIETGRFFQKFGVYDLRFASSDGDVLPVEAGLEISAWPNQVLFTLSLRSAPASTVTLDFSTGSETFHAEGEGNVTLAVPAGAGGRVARPDEMAVEARNLDEKAQSTVDWVPEDQAYAVRLRYPAWPAALEGNYPEAKLDTFEQTDFTVTNPSDVERTVGLVFDYVPIKAIWSYVPMLLDPAGNPTGIPVQISKDWHDPGKGIDIPHQGAWMHGRVWLHVPAHAKLALRYGTTYARWGGVPTASGSQLSLVGYSHNGFWDQWALGGFGETVCFQAGRVMRRSLLTDLRPLLQKGFAKNDRWSWTTNVGGADTMVRIDPAGHYVPFKRNYTRYASHGPNLVDFTYGELSDDGAISSRTEVLMPRTDDHVRLYFKIRYDVHQAVTFSELAFFQLGTAFYAGCDAPSFAYGHGAKLTKEEQPKVTSDQHLAAAELTGDQPWCSLYGEVPKERADSGQGSRGLIVREWHAVLGGKEVRHPYFAAFGSEGKATRLGAELTVPPGLHALQAGDYVEATLELTVMPLTAESYYGPNEDFRQALAASANTWHMVSREAAQNRPSLRTFAGIPVRGVPLSFDVAQAGDHPFQLVGGLGWVTLRFEGLPSHEALTLYRKTATGLERVQQGPATQAWWQTDYDIAKGTWVVTCNVPAPTDKQSYVARVSTP